MPEVMYFLPQAMFHVKHWVAERRRPKMFKGGLMWQWTKISGKKGQ
jgi:hypothetical protein